MEAALKAVIGADISQLEKGFKVANDTINNFSSNIKGINSALNNALNVPGFKTLAKDAEAAADKVRILKNQVSSFGGGVKVSVQVDKDAFRQLSQNNNVTLRVDTKQLTQEGLSAVANLTKTVESSKPLLKIGVDTNELKSKGQAAINDLNLSLRNSNSTVKLNVDTTDLITGKRAIEQISLAGAMINVPGLKIIAADATEASAKSIKLQNDLKSFGGGVSVGIRVDEKAFAQLAQDKSTTLKVAVEADMGKITQFKNSIAGLGKDVNVKLGLTVDNAGVLKFKKSTADLEAQLKSFQTGLKNATGVDSINRLNNAIAATKQRIDAIKNVSNPFAPLSNGAGQASTALNKATKGSNEAGFALQNLGRVAQDAPFGFIGIQNNINPLLESFQRLKTETGSTKGALSALAGSLTGGAGLGLAVSVATGLLTVLAQNGFFKTAEAADLAKKKADEYKETLKGIFSGAAQEATQVQSFIAVLKSETATRERKLATIKELNNLNPEVFGGLKLEGNLVAGLDKAYQSYIENLKTVVAVKIKQSQLEKVTQSILEKEGVTLSGQGKALKTVLDNQNKLNAARIKDARNPFLEAQAKKQAEINGLNKEALQLQKEISELQAGVKVNIDPTPKPKAAKDIKTYADIVAELRKELATIQGNFDLSRITFSEADVNRVKAYEKAFEGLFDLGAKATTPIVQSLAVELQPIDARVNMRLLEEILAKFKDDKPIVLEPPVQVKPYIEPSNNDVPDFDSYRAGIIQQLKAAGVKKIETSQGIKIPISFPVNTEELKAALSKAQVFITDFSNLVTSSVQNLEAALIGAFAEGVANLAAGAETVGGVFRGLFLMVADAMIQFGKSAIAMGITATALKKLQSKPGLAIAAGIATLALGALVKASIPKFAKGTMTTGPTAAIIGDNPSGREYVLPSESISRLAAELNEAGQSRGGSTPYLLDTVIQGQDLKVILQRADNSFNRRF